MVFDGVDHEVCHFFRALSAFSVGVVDDEWCLQRFFAMGLEECHFFIGVGGKAVEHHHHALAEAAQVLHVAVEVGQASAKSFEVRLLDGIERHAAVHLQALSSGNDDGEGGLQTALAAEDVVELLCTEVSTEAGFRDGVVAV